jgi:hypothetical protein
VTLPKVLDTRKCSYICPPPAVFDACVCFCDRLLDAGIASSTRGHMWTPFTSSARAKGRLPKML